MLTLFMFRPAALLLADDGASARIDLEPDQRTAIAQQLDLVYPALRTALVFVFVFAFQFDIDHLVSVRAHFIDRLILIAWRASGLQASADEGALLL